LSTSNKFKCEIGNLPSLNALEQLWSSLSAESTSGFYLSWPWIRAWLSCLPAHITPRLLTIRTDDRIVGLAVLTKSQVRRHLFFTSRTWALHTTAIPDLDCVFIEHNGLLSHDADKTDAWRAWASAFADLHKDWDEIRLAGVSPQVLDVWRRGGYRLQEDMQLVSRYVDLNEVRQSGVDYVSGLGKNTRARIRYTRRIFEDKYGPIQLTFPVDIDQALSFYEELKALHQQTWIDRGEKGSFANPFFDSFHQLLIRDGFATGCIQLLHVTAGSRTLGVLYNLVHGGEVNMYQSGFDYSVIDAPNKQSPGLLTHALAIQYCLDRGYRRYDFLAGDNQYKRVLANRAEKMWWGRVQRNRLRFRLEDSARALWHRWRRLTPRPHAESPV
jgi:hypothetical protein